MFPPLVWLGSAVLAPETVGPLGETNGAPLAVACGKSGLEFAAAGEPAGGGKSDPIGFEGPLAPAGGGSWRASSAVSSGWAKKASLATDNRWAEFSAGAPASTNGMRTLSPAKRVPL